jgi:hypothetical protein
MLAAARPGIRGLARRMRAVTLPFSDSFTRSDGLAEDATHPWYTPPNGSGGRLQVISNKLALTSGVANTKATLLLPNDDVDVQFDFTQADGTVGGSTGDMQVRMFLYDPMLRSDEPVDYYLFATSISYDGWTLSRVHNGALTTVMTAASVLTRGSTYTVRLRFLTGGRIRVYIGGVLQVQETVYFTPAAGQTALEFLADDTTIKFDTLTIVASVASTPGVDGVISDPFTRANGALTVTPTGETYTVVQKAGTHNAQVTSNQLSLGPSAVAADVSDVWLDLGATEQTLTIDTPTVSVFTDGTKYLTFWLRYASSTDHILCQWAKAGGTWLGGIYKVAGSTTTLTTASFGGTDPSKISCKITAAGVITASFYVAGTPTDMTATDNTRTGTKVGLELVGTSVYDNLVTSTP